MIITGFMYCTEELPVSSGVSFLGSGTAFDKAPGYGFRKGIISQNEWEMKQGDRENQKTLKIVKRLTSNHYYLFLFRKSIKLYTVSSMQIYLLYHIMILAGFFYKKH
jgi:hypothetical protein